MSRPLVTVMEDPTMAKKKSETKPPDQVPEAGLLPEGYEAFLSELKERIRTAQLRATLAVNRELSFFTGGRDATFWPGRRNTAGEPRSSTGCPRTFAGNSPASRVSLPETSSICGHLPRLGPRSQLCKRCLHKLPGTTT